MPQLSKKKKNKIIEQILHLLFSLSPELQFTSKIAQEIARDEEFVRSLLEEIYKNNLLIKVQKNPQGFNYKRRVRWGLSKAAYKAYSKQQDNNNYQS